MGGWVIPASKICSQGVNHRKSRRKHVKTEVTGMVRCSRHMKRHQQPSSLLYEKRKNSRQCMQDCVGEHKGWNSEICDDHRVTISAIKLQTCLTPKNCKVRNIGRAGPRQNCSGHSRVSSSLQSLQCMLKAPWRQAVLSKPRATHPPSGPTAESPHRIRTVRTMFADFAARGRSGLKSRELNWTAPVKLAAVQSSPWLQLAMPEYLK